MKTLLLTLLLLCSFRMNRAREEIFDYPTLLRQGIYEVFNEVYSV